MAEIPTPDALEERLLLDRLKRIEQNMAGYFAVHLHLSELKPANRKAHFIRLAARAFENVIGQYEAVLYQFVSSDLVLICRSVPVEDVELPVEKVRGLFSEDPLTEIDETGLEEDRLCTWYDLSNDEDFNSFHNMVALEALHAEQDSQRKKEEAAEKQKSVGRELTPKLLNALSQQLIRIDIKDLVRNQLCLHIGANGPEGVLFRESFISIGDMKHRIAPGVNVFSSTWLFQYMTETLDKVMLSTMSKATFDATTEPISINLNIATVLSRDFQAFHRAVGDHTNKVVIEMQVLDIFTDMESFNIARDMLQQNGYRVLVDGISPVAIQFFDPSLLNADYLKIGWGREFEGDADTDRVRELRRIIRDAGKESIILARVDSEAAIQWGLNLGITRFQGFLMDRLIDAVRAQGRRARLRVANAKQDPKQSASAAGE